MKIKKLKREENALLAVAVLSQTTIAPTKQTISLEAADYSLEHNLHFSDVLFMLLHALESTALYK